MTPLKKHALHHVWLLAFAVIVIVLCLNGVLAYKTLGDLARNQRSVAATLGTINTITDTYAALLNAETGQRGYLLTGEAKYLEPFHGGIKRVRQLLKELEQETTGLRAQQALVEQLEVAINAKIEELHTVMAKLQENGLAQIPMGLSSSQGKPKMDQVRDLINLLKKEQYALLTQRTAEAMKSRRSALATLVTSTAVSLLLVILIYYVVRSSNRLREKLTHNLQKANDDLETKVQERTTALSHYANELGRNNRELQDFAFVASHDLQEPLRKIRAFGNRLQQKCASELGEQGADYINRMQAAAERMSRLINDLLAFSRAATKGTPFRSTALNKILEDVLDDLEVAIDESHAEITLDDLPVIEADATQMHQLFQNLLGNAIKFRHAHTPPRIRVTKSTYDTLKVGNIVVEDVCEITIADNGIGFDQQFIERIFTPFQRLHGQDKYTGTGIGLAVCHRIVERHQGILTAESVPGEGSRFIIKLPLKQVVKPLHEIHNHDSEQT